MEILIYIIVLLGILILKFFIFKKAKLVSVDQWYWLKYRDTVKNQKQFPPILSEYLLEVRQWYPPLFGWLLSQFPDRIFKYSNLLTQLLSFLRLMLVVGFAYILNIGFSLSLFLAIVVYLTAPIIIYYDNQINSRIFGAIILDILILLFFGYFEYDLVCLIFPLILFTVLLLFTHKMTHQLYFFLLFGLSFYFLSFVPFLIYLMANIIAFVFFNYKNYFKHHIEIVKFWHRNRYKLGAHQFYESNIYGKKNFVYVNRMHGNGLKSVIKKLSLIIGMFPFTLFIVFNLEMNIFGLIFFVSVLFILLTSFVDKLLCLGSGNLYTYNLITIASFYLIYTDIEITTISNQFLFIVVVFMTIGSIYKFYKGLKNKNRDEKFVSAIEFLNKSSLDRVMVIPFQLPDEVAYQTSKKVFFGGHGYGFLWIEPYFPVMNEKVEKAINDWNLGAVFLQKVYFKEFFKEVDMSIFNTVFENDEYTILEVKNWKDEGKTPKWAIEKYPDLFGNKNV